MITSCPLRLRPLILLVGDSLTQQGYGLNGGTGWASMLANAFSNRADVLNRGFSGYNTRLICQELLKTLPEQADYFFCTVFLGANDAALPGERQHVPIEEYTDNLEKIVTHLRKTSRSDLPIILMSPPPVDTERWDRHNRNLERDPAYRANDVAKQYGERVQKVAETHDCLYLDVFDALQGNKGTYQDFLSDGLHLSSSGNSQVYRSLVDLLARQGETLLPDSLPEDEYTDLLVSLHRPSVVLLGDSFTEAGFDNNGWIAQLASDYSRRADVWVRGFKEINTRQFKSKLAGCLTVGESEGGPREVLFVTLWLGANDEFPTDGDGVVPLDEFRVNLVEIIATLRSSFCPAIPSVNEDTEVPVVLVTPPPSINPQTLGRGPPYTRLTCPYAEVVVEVAEETNCGLVDLFAAFQSQPDEQFWESDGAHLNQQGNALVHKSIMEALEMNYPQLTPMTDGNGKYGKSGVPLEGKIWSELC